MAFQLFDEVRIIDKDITGTIVDLYTGGDGQTVYIVESRERGYATDPDAYPGDFPLYDATEDRLIKI